MWKPSLCKCYKLHLTVGQENTIEQVGSKNKFHQFSETLDDGENLISLGISNIDGGPSYSLFSWQGRILLSSDPSSQNSNPDTPHVTSKIKLETNTTLKLL